MTPNCAMIPFPVFSKTIKDNVVMRIVALRDIAPGEEWLVNYGLGDRATRDKHGKDWPVSAWCLYEDDLLFRFTPDQWVSKLVHWRVWVV